MKGFHLRCRRLLGLAIIAGNSLAGFCAPVPAGKPPPRPNIILAMTDDQGWGETGYNGHPTLRTPTLDAMARSGVRFDRFYAPTVCTPTRASVLTGRHPYRMGIYGANAGAADDRAPSRYRLPREEVTLAEALKPRGYTNGFFGKWHLGDFGGAMKSSPDEHGFDHWFATTRKVRTLDPQFYHENGRRVETPLRGDDSAVLVDRALEFVRSAAGTKQPFLLVLWFHAPHEPVAASAGARAAYAGLPEQQQHYYGSLTATDTALGRLRTALRELNIADDTLLWFCSDNGSVSPAGTGGALLGRKGTLFEGGIRVPSVLEWPAKFPRARRLSMPCVTSDIYPTLLDWLELAVPTQPPCDGISLARPLERRSRQRSRPIGFELGGMGAWMEERWKLVVHLRGGGEPRREIAEVKLFDIVADPGEERDRAADYPGRARTMTAAFAAWRGSCAESRAGNDYR